MIMIGGNSTIGQAIIKGLKKKYSNHNQIKVTSFARGQSEFKNLGDVIFVKNYIESILHIKEVKIKNPNLKIIIFIVLVYWLKKKRILVFTIT